MKRLCIFPPGHSSSCTADFGWACGSSRGNRAFATLDGRAFGGSYAESLKWLEAQREKPSALIAIFSRGDGMESWLEAFHELLPGLPVVGGAAARAPGSLVGETLPTAGDVALFAIDEGNWRATAFSPMLPAATWFHLPGKNPRRFSIGSPGGERLLKELDVVRQENGIGADDWDRVALTDREGIVYHLHREAGEIVSGADIYPAREVAPAVFYPQAIRKFRELWGSSALVFGCAGLVALHESGLPWEDVPFTSLYGEIHSGGSRPRFSNLTLTVLHRVM